MEVGAVGPYVGPFVEQGPVEALCLPVGARRVGPGAGMGDAELGAAITPRTADVAAAVVGQDAFDGHTVGREPRHRAFEERTAVLGVFDRQDLAVGDTAVGVDHPVHVVVTDTLALAVAGLEAIGAPATTTRDPTELLRIDVHELAGPAGFDPSDHATGRPVDPTQPVQLPPDQHSVHGRGVHFHNPGDAGRPELAVPAEPLDALLERHRRLVRAAMRAARTIMQAGVAFGPPPGPPFVDRRP